MHVLLGTGSTVYEMLCDYIHNTILPKLIDKKKRKKVF